MTEIEIKDDDEIEQMLSKLEDWSSEMLDNDWRFIENSGSTSKEYYKREQDAASKRSYERFLIIEKLRDKLLCRG